MNTEKMTVKQEAESRGVSISQVRKERQTRAENQPLPALNLEVGKRYLDGFGKVVKIIEKRDGGDFPYVGDNNNTFNNHGLYMKPEFVYLKKSNLVKEAD